MKPQALLKSTAYSIVVAALLVATIITVGNGLVAAELEKKKGVLLPPLEFREKILLGKGVVTSETGFLDLENGSVRTVGVKMETTFSFPVEKGEKIVLVLNGNNLKIIPYTKWQGKADANVVGYGKVIDNHNFVVSSFMKKEGVTNDKKVNVFFSPIPNGGRGVFYAE